MRTEGYNPIKSNPPLPLDLSKPFELHYPGGSENYFLLNALYVINEIAKMGAPFSLVQNYHEALRRGPGFNSEITGTPELVRAYMEYTEIIRIVENNATSAILERLREETPPQEPPPQPTTPEISEPTKPSPTTTESEELVESPTEALVPELVTEVESTIPLSAKASRSESIADADFKNKTNEPRDRSKKPKKAGFGTNGLFVNKKN